MQAPQATDDAGSDVRLAPRQPRFAICDFAPLDHSPGSFQSPSFCYALKISSLEKVIVQDCSGLFRTVRGCSQASNLKLLSDLTIVVDVLHRLRSRQLDFFSTRLKRCKNLQVVLRAGVMATV